MRLYFTFFFVGEANGEYNKRGEDIFVSFTNQSFLFYV